MGVDVIAGKIDELAADLLVQEDPDACRSKWVASLIALAEHARAAGLEGVASIADATAVTLSSSPLDGPELASVFEGKLTSLRSALDAKGAAATTPAPPTTTSSIADDPELIADFVLESREHLENIEAQVLALEQDARNIEALHSTFRSFHTIKGLAGFLELIEVREVSHEVETVLDKARQGEFTIDAGAIDVILASKDYLGGWLKHLDHGKPATVPEHLTANQPLLERIRALLISGKSTEGSEAPPHEPAVSSTEAPPAAAPAPAPAAKMTDHGNTRQASRSVKVDTTKLDYLVDMVGEMVIAQSMVRHDPALAALQNPRLARNLSQLVRITDEVQRTAMSMRMVPIGPLFQKMARLVRDLGRKFGKQVHFESDGEDVELDRNIVEELADPLMHMIRNSIDHGIESPQERAASGKPPSARVMLRAYHRSGQIVIEVSDDGRGIDREKVLAKARSKGLIAPGASISDAECLNLIFHPGFSTATQVSDVSGRGVGMDVVKKHIIKLRGSVDIESPAGKGTIFSLRLPLTLAIIDGLVVSVGEKRYIIPLAAVREMLRPTAEMVKTVENRAEIVTIRDRVVPMIRLYERFNTTPRTTDPTEGVLVLAEIEGTPFCVMVDDLIGKQEVVIKSLGSLFRHVSGLAGGAILGDGQVGLILDLPGLFGGKGEA